MRVWGAGGFEKDTAVECVAAMTGRPAGDVPEHLVSKPAAFGAPGHEMAEAARLSGKGD